MLVSVTGMAAAEFNVEALAVAAGVAAVSVLRIVAGVGAKTVAPVVTFVASGAAFTGRVAPAAAVAGAACRLSGNDML